MKAKELVREMKEDFTEEKKHVVKCIMKDKLFELENAESVVKELKRQYEEFLEKTVDDIYYDED